MYAQFANVRIGAGFGATQGVFREYYFKHTPFEGNQLVASIGLLVVVSLARFRELQIRLVWDQSDKSQGHATRTFAIPSSLYR